MMNLFFKWLNVKRMALVCCLLNNVFFSHAQKNHEAIYHYSDSLAQQVINRIDSIANTAGIASHFCKTYSRSMQNIRGQMKGMDSGAQIFIKRFEIRFAAYFLQPWNEYLRGTLSDTSVWNSYYSGKAVYAWQYVLLGVNAHVKGDMWKALVNEFSEKEMGQNKKLFISFQTSISKNYDVFFDELMAQNGYVRFINAFTKGLAKFTGEKVIAKWRRRQVKLAILFYSNAKKFRKKLAINNRKKQKNDKLILSKAK